MHSNSNPTKKSTQAKRISVSFESQQETAIMALLAYHGIKFVVVPPRKSCSNCQFIDIKTIVIENQSFDFQSFIEHYIVANNKELSKDTPHFNKYQKRNLTAATNNVLTDMLKVLGWKISFKNSKEATITLKMERINVLSFGGIVINGEDIACFGEKLNKELKGVVSQKRDAPLMIGKNELLIEKYIDLSALAASDLSPIIKMLQPTNVSCQIGYVMNENGNQTNEMNQMEYHYENEDRRDETERYVIECSKILDGQNQSQNASQSIAGTVLNCASSVSMNGQIIMNGMYNGFIAPCACATPLAAAQLQANGNDEKGDMRRERDIIERITENIEHIQHVEQEHKFTCTEGEQFEDELPPATNVPTPMNNSMNSVNDMNQQSMGQMPQSSDSTITTATDYNVMYTLVDGQVYLLQYLPYYGWCYYPCGIEMKNESKNVMSNAMVEGVQGGEEEVDCGFMQMTNYYNAV